MRTISITVYDYSELTDHSKHNAKMELQMSYGFTDEEVEERAETEFYFLENGKVVEIDF